MPLPETGVQSVTAAVVAVRSVVAVECITDSVDGHLGAGDTVGVAAYGGAAVTAVSQPFLRPDVALQRVAQSAVTVGHPGLYPAGAPFAQVHRSTLPVREPEDAGRAAVRGAQGGRGDDFREHCLGFLNAKI